MSTRDIPPELGLVLPTSSLPPTTVAPRATSSIPTPGVAAAGARVPGAPTLPDVDGMAAAILRVANELYNSNGAVGPESSLMGSSLPSSTHPSAAPPALPTSSTAAPTTTLPDAGVASMPYGSAPSSMPNAPSTTSNAGAPIDAGAPSTSSNARAPLERGAPSSSSSARAPREAGAPSTSSNARAPLERGAPSSMSAAQSEAGAPSTSNARAPREAGAPSTSSNARAPLERGAPSSMSAAQSEAGAPSSSSAHTDSWRPQPEAGTSWKLGMNPFLMSPKFDDMLGVDDDFRIPLVDLKLEEPTRAPPITNIDVPHEVEPVVDVRPSGFDPYAVKAEFPILNERVHGKQLVWLDNAATTQKPRAVIERLKYFYEHENSNIHRAAHALAARATDAYEGARETTRRFLNASSKNEIVFVRGATEGINLVAQSWGRRYIEAGDEIVLTNLEHHANIVPWQMLCAQKGARLRVAPVDDSGQIILEEYQKLFNDKTKLAAIPQVSNALGTITPAMEMIEIAHRFGAKVLLDGAQAVSHMPVDVQLLDCDFFVFSGHKVFAPTGIGAVYGKSAILDVTPPWQGGGNMIQDVTFEKTSYQPPPFRFEAGTGNIADAVGLGAALDWLTRTGIVNVERHEHDLLVYATEKLLSIDGITIIGTAKEKAGVISFTVAGHSTAEVSEYLDKQGIAVRGGHHCAQPILRRFGLESTVRASFAPYNTREDVDILVDALVRMP